MKITEIKKSGFEEVIRCVDTASGLDAIIAIHSTRLGPALGGIRMHAYRNRDEALADALRLAKAMSYKAAAAGLKLGGGKAVILGDPGSEKTLALLRTMGAFIHRFKGRYISAKDAGITTENLVEIAKETPHVTGLPESMGGSDDPSPWTAKSVIEGMRACLQEKWGRTDFKGLTVLIQGVGHVGFSLGELLRKLGANLIISDIDSKAVARARRNLKAKVIEPNQVYETEVDILAPCALGGFVNDRTIDRLRCQVIAGGANNQLTDEAKHGKQLLAKGILYAPDYILNAGGLINIYVKDLLREVDSMPHIRKVRTKVEAIFRDSRTSGKPPAIVANEMTERVLKG